MMPLRVAGGLTQTADKRIPRNPLVNLPDKGGPLTPCRSRRSDLMNQILAPSDVDTFAQSSAKRLPQTLELTAKLVAL